MSFKDKLQQNRLGCFDKTRPLDITESQWEAAKQHALTHGSRLSAEIEQSAYYFYFIGYSFDDIAAKLMIPVESLIYTCLFYNWHERRETSDSTRAGAKVTKADAAAIDLITDSIVATAALYKSRLHEAIKDPTKAKDCPFIPKNFKELQTLLTMLQSLQTEKPGESGKQSINVNIANLAGNAAHPTPLPESQRPGVIDAETVDALPEHKSEDTLGLEAGEKLDLLKLLEKVRKS